MLEDLPKVAIMEDEESNIHMRNLSIHRANNEEEALNLVRFLHVQQHIRKLASLTKLCIHALCVDLSSSFPDCTTCT